ncbi:MAG: hypothetical protein ACRCUS_06330 [Anaerovoracaceae bacterium]
MNYGEIENKYIKAGLEKYKFNNALEVKKILGYDFRTMRGFKALSDSDKELAEWLICKYINGHGLTSREAIRPTGIKRESGRFKVSFKDGEYSYLFDNGSIG